VPKVRCVEGPSTSDSRTVFLVTVTQSGGECLFGAQSSKETLSAQLRPPPLKSAQGKHYQRTLELCLYQNTRRSFPGWTGLPAGASRPFGRGPLEELRALRNTIYYYTILEIYIEQSVYCSKGPRVFSFITIRDSASARRMQFHKLGY